MNKKKLKEGFKFVGIKALGAFIFVAVAGTSLWALAAFTEPTVGPSSSVQDFAKNVMGANNSDNAFDSSSVTANSDGSIVERLENIESKLLATAITSEAGSTMTHSAAAVYCRDLSATTETVINGSNASTTYNDWRLGSMIELANFEGSTASTNYIWSATPRDATIGYWLTLRLSDGGWSTYIYTTSHYVRCVR